MNRILPSTTHRVPMHTASSVNDEIYHDALHRVRCLSGDRQAIGRRIQELDYEWDIERTLETNATILSLIGLALTMTVSRWFLLVPLVVLSFLLQHALQGWCPPVPLFRRMGTRTAAEIEAERYALKAARGDFQNLSDDPVRRSQQVLQSAEHGT